MCLGLPGALPVVNRTAVESAIRIGLALNCTIAPWCRFARKNYFYPDMPKNFQTVQYDEPIAVDGYLDVTLDDGTTVRVEIERAHMEEDTGKSLHVGGATGRIHGAEYSLLDYNRAGVPLIEIVTKMIPDTGARAPGGGPGLRHGAARPAASRSVSPTCGWTRARCAATPTCRSRRRGSGELGTRTETKNVNSLRSVERAVRYEITPAGRRARRRRGRSSRRPGTSTSPAGTTAPGRRKETAEDYRYFPEPDLVPIAPLAGVGRRAARHAARAAVGAPGPAAGRVGPHRPGDARPGRRGRARPDRGHRRRGRPAGRGPVVVGVVPGAAGQRARRARWTALPITPGAAGAGDRAGRVGRADHHAGPPGRRRRAGRRGRPGRGRRRPRAGGRVRRGRAGRGGRRGAGRPARRGREDPRRQGAGGGRDRRRGDEGDRRPGRRQAGARAGAGGLCASNTVLAAFTAHDPVVPIGRVVHSVERRPRAADPAVA